MQATGNGKYKALANEKREAADKTLSSNLKLVNKIKVLEKKIKKQNDASTTMSRVNVVNRA